MLNTVVSTGLLVWNENLTFRVFLEIAQIFQYIFNIFLVLFISIVKFWIVIIAARVSTIWLIE